MHLATTHVIQANMNSLSAFDIQIQFIVCAAVTKEQI